MFIVGESASTTSSISTQTATNSEKPASPPSKHAASPSTSSVLCSCPVCHKFESDDLKGLWLELKMAVLRIYTEAGVVLSQNFMDQNKLDLSSHSKFPLPCTEHLKEIVHRYVWQLIHGVNADHCSPPPSCSRLCVYDRHKLYQCLEAHIRLFVVEIRLNLLSQLEHGSQALFEAMFENYNKLCKASKKTAHFLQELESKHLRKFNLTWEFLNRRLFQSTVYCDAFIKHGLPK